MLAVPAILRGGVSRGLVEAAVIGLVVLVALFAIGERADRLRRSARVGRPHDPARPQPAAPQLAEPLRRLPAAAAARARPDRRDLGPRWKRALAATGGRWAFDYATLLAALAAVGSQPRPGLVLLAFCAAQVLAQIPITPGGLGFVEAGLTGTLTLIGVPAGSAVLATFAYRLFSYWLQLPVGLAAFGWHARRYAGSITPAGVTLSHPARVEESEAQRQIHTGGTA